MCILIKITCLSLAVNFWFCKNFCVVSGERPHCKGDPLKPKDFSKTDEVGFARDLLVEELARNLFNLIDYPVPSACEELANIRTSTCFFGRCSKWKRESYWSIGVKKRVMDKAEALVKHFNTVVSKKTSLKKIEDEKLILGIIEDVKSRLVNSGATDEESKIIGELGFMMYNFCERYIIGQVEKKELKKLKENKDVLYTMSIFFQDFEAKNQVKISNYYIEVNVMRTDSNKLNDIIRLKFEYVKDMVKSSNSVILKIPSLSTLHYEVLKTADMFDREIYLYSKVLPELYRLGKCEPFAPILHSKTIAGALVIEDLNVEGYKLGDRMKQLNYGEAIETLNVLATFHAAGHKYLKTITKEEATESLIAPDQPMLLEFIGRRKHESFNELCRIATFYICSVFAYQLRKFESECLSEPVMRSIHPADNINVIMHGDCRTNNILFKYNDKGEAYQAKLINWKLSRIGNPVVDLIYFFVTSVNVDVYITNDQSLFVHYIRTLSDKLELSESTVYDKLHGDLNDSKYYFFNVLSNYLSKLLSAQIPGDLKSQYKGWALKWLRYLYDKYLLK